MMLNTYIKQIIFCLIECVPRDDDECLASTPNWSSTKDCAYAKKYCDSWAKDARRCCPQTCGSGLLTESQCNALNSIGHYSMSKIITSIEGKVDINLIGSFCFTVTLGVG